MAMKLGTLEVDLVKDATVCDECTALADLILDGQAQCLQHASARLRDDPEALGAMAHQLLLLYVRKNVR